MLYERGNVMMAAVYADIPRIHTALAEWAACMVYVLILEKRFSKKQTILLSMGALLCQILVLAATDDVPLMFWIPCMLIAAGAMYLFLYCCCRITMFQAAYCCTAAFIIAEFEASLEWQLFAYLDLAGVGFLGMGSCILILTYSVVFTAAVRLEQGILKKEYLEHLSKWELVSTVALVVLTFAASNVRFLLSDAEADVSVCLDILKMRTLIDFSGLAVLYAFQSRVSEYLSEKEIEAIRTMLKSQYDQYRSYQESIELLRIQRHDLKHHIAVLRAETNAEKREEWLDRLEEELNASEIAAPTGNRVLDIMLTVKQGVIKKNGIHFTWVADGTLLDFMHVTDICTILGNALDNAIENVVILDDPKKRLIHLSISLKKDFVFIQMRNYCEREPDWDGKGSIRTTKADKENHGYGIRSIRYTVEKYGGSTQVSWKDEWFELGLLIPKPAGWDK